MACLILSGGFLPPAEDRITRAVEAFLSFYGRVDDVLRHAR
jgi:hypothetical protein